MKQNIFTLSMALVISLCTHTMNAQQPELKQIKNLKRGVMEFQQTTPEWSLSANMYEVNVRQFTPEGTLNAFSKHLPRLSQMGVKIIWLMPVQPIGIKNRKGTLGSYYSIRDYMAINPEMGSMEDFVNLVKNAHGLGIKVILDWVANHTAWDHPWVSNNPDFYTKNEKGEMIPPVADWADVVDLNYDNPAMRRAMTDAMLFWVKAADIDGFRCDVADMVPSDFWRQTRKELDAIKPVFMLAEAENPEMHANGFDMTYAFSQHHIMNEIVKGEKNALAIDEYRAEQERTFKPMFTRMYFTSSHDENSWSGSEYERMGDGALAFAVLTFGMDGMPMIYSGQEAALNKRLDFFEKDEINWGDFPLNDFYTRLLKLKANNGALHHAGAGGKFVKINTSNDKDVYVFARVTENEKVLFILNLSKKAQKVNINDVNLAGEYLELFTEKKSKLSAKATLSLKPWEYQVWVK